MSTSQQFAKIIEQVAPRVAVIFNGQEPRLIGTVTDEAPTAAGVRNRVDAMLIRNRLSASKISVAAVGGQVCIVAHG